MKEMKIFKSQEFGSIRTLAINDEPWFVGKDVAVHQWQWSQHHHKNPKSYRERAAVFY